MKKVLNFWNDYWLESFIFSASLFILLHFFYIILAFALDGPNLGF